MRIPPFLFSSRVKLDRISHANNSKSKLRKYFGIITLITFAIIASASSITAQQIDFESPTYSIGNINGQNGWQKTGSFDSVVSATTATGFGTQAFRISNAVTNGSFGDQTFSPSIANEAGETAAENGGISGGTRQNVFQTEFSIASAVPGAEQTGLSISMSPDRGDGARMSYLRFEDQADGIRVYFDDYKDAYPFGTTIIANSPTGCAGSDDFRETLISTLDRTIPHKIKLVMFLYDGPRNDVVQVFVDGVLRITGTSWEDYFRYCEGKETRTVDSLIFRAAGTAAPATNGNGFLFDNLTNSSSTASVITATPSNTQGWFVSSNTVGGVVSYIYDSTAPSGQGTLRLTTTDDNQSRAHYTHPVNNITFGTLSEMSYYSKTNSGPAVAGPSYSIGVLLDGTPGSLTELVFEPYWNNGVGAVTKNIWKKWDVYSAPQLWSSSTYDAGGGCSVSAGSGGPPFYTISGLQAVCPNAVVVSQKAYIGSYNKLYDVEVDLFSLNNTAYDFEPNDPSIVKITPADLTSVPNASDWFIYNDENDTINNSLATFIVGPGTPQYGVGSVNMNVTGTQRKNIATYKFTGTPLANINVLKYSTYNPSTGNGGSANRSGYLQFNVDFDGSDTFQRRLISLPTDNGSVVQDNWQEWDTINGGNALWRYSGATWPGGSVLGTTPKTWSQIISEYPGVRIRVTDSFLGVRVGSPYADGYTEDIDSLTFGTAAGTTIYDFEPNTPSVTINQAVGQGDPTSVGPINFTVTFSEPVSGFDGSDVTLTGPGSAGATATVTGGPTLYNVAVTGMSNNGVVIATIAAGVANGTTSSAPNAASTSTDNSVYYVATCNVVSIPTAIPTLTGVQLDVPLNTDDLTGRSAFGYETTLTYNPAVLSYIGIQQVGTLSSGLTIVPNAAVPGTLSITGFSTGPAALTGSGTLLKVRFQVVGAISPTPSPINFTNFIYNEGNPCSSTLNGSVQIISGTLSGTVTYINGTPTTPGVPNVNIAGTGTGGNVSTTTDGSGNYGLSGFGAGAYTVTPSKAPLPLGSFNSAISNTDSTRIAQHTVGLITLNANQIIAGDVTNNGTVSNLDATYIAQWKVGIANPGNTGTWIFQPVSRNYANVNASLSGENYNAILKGDVTGNWNPLEPPMFAPTDQKPSKDAVIVTVGDIKAASGSQITVPIDITDITSKGVTGYEFEMNYDPKVLEPADVIADLAGTVSEGRTVVANSPEEGRLLVVVYGVFPLSSKGTLINLHFSVVGTKGSDTAIGLRNLVLNENEIESYPVAGKVHVVGTKDGGVIRGRVLSFGGEGISGARVIATDTRGRSFAVRTNSFGSFEFGDLVTGESYIVTVMQKGLSFTPVNVALTDQDVQLQLLPR